MTSAAQLVQQRWQGVPLADRLLMLKRARHRMSGMGDAFVAAISPRLARNAADTLVTELLPLLDACRFLERNAERILAPRRTGAQGRPFWLSGVQAEVHRDPFGHVLIIGPSNFPLFLPGVQTLQAIAAGNIVTWKPGEGGRGVADLVAGVLLGAGLHKGVLTVTDDTVSAGRNALSQRPDKIVFTGSAGAGRHILAGLAETCTPAVMELSGADAVIVLPSADLALAAKAIAFGLRLNGGAVCMSPRRLLALGDTMTKLLPLLEHELAGVPAVPLAENVANPLRQHLDQAIHTGARLLGQFSPEAQKPLLVDGALPHMSVTSADLFAPVLSLITVSTIAKIPDVLVECPYALTASIFGEEAEARLLAEQVRAGTVLINDVIVSTTDPRVPFGGRDASGFGVTRGEEGLLEMTAPKALLVRRKGTFRNYEQTTAAHVPFFMGLVRAAHAASWRERAQGVSHLIRAARAMQH